MLREEARAWQPSALGDSTFHVPATVQTNLCFLADMINLNGDIHVTVTTINNKWGKSRRRECFYVRAAPRA